MKKQFYINKLRAQCCPSLKQCICEFRQIEYAKVPHRVATPYKVRRCYSSSAPEIIFSYITINHKKFRSSAIILSKFAQISMNGHFYNSFVIKLQRFAQYLFDKKNISSQYLHRRRLFRSTIKCKKKYEQLSVQRLAWNVKMASVNGGRYETTTPSDTANAHWIEYELHWSVESWWVSTIRVHSLTNIDRLTCELDIWWVWMFECLNWIFFVTNNYQMS